MVRVENTRESLLLDASLCRTGREEFPCQGQPVVFNDWALGRVRHVVTVAMDAFQLFRALVLLHVLAGLATHVTGHLHLCALSLEVTDTSTL